MTQYKLRNLATGREFNDEGWTLNDPAYDKPSLIRADYTEKQLNLRDSSLGIYRFSGWLPVNRFLNNAPVTITYKSEKYIGNNGV